MESEELLSVVSVPGTGVVVEGTLSWSSAEGFVERLSEQSVSVGEVILLLRGLDIEDGRGLIEAVDAIRALLHQGKRIVVKGVPQMLGHNLYRLGLLDGQRLVLVDMRADEAYG